VISASSVCRAEALREGDWFSLGSLTTPVIAETFRGFVVVNRRHKRHVQHTRAIVISEHNKQSAGRIQERVITRWHVNHRAISGAQPERLARIDC
jgi:hypothetical protein